MKIINMANRLSQLPRGGAGRVWRWRKVLIVGTRQRSMAVGSLFGRLLLYHDLNRDIAGFLKMQGEWKTLAVA